jgi:NCAIR mutase (PurE)-related protein
MKGVKSIRNNKTKKRKSIKKTTRKLTRVSNKLINTRNEKCIASNSTKCCPHMNTDEKGRYHATNEKSILHYKGAKYELHTCCLMCSEEMNKLAKTNIVKFNKLHKPIKHKNGLLLANGHTGKYVQFVQAVN